MVISFHSQKLGQLFTLAFLLLPPVFLYPPFLCNSGWVSEPCFASMTLRTLFHLTNVYKISLWNWYLRYLSSSLFFVLTFETTVFKQPTQIVRIFIDCLSLCSHLNACGFCLMHSEHCFSCDSICCLTRIISAYSLPPFRVAS